MLKELPPERILIEFDKIVKKGDKLLGAVLLDETGLFKEIFGKSPYYDFRNSKYLFNSVKTIGEYIYLISAGIVSSPSDFFKNNLKGDLDSFKEIKALETAFENAEETNSIVLRSVAHNMYLISPKSLESQIIPNSIKISAKELLDNKYPKTIGELQINGNDLIQLGYKGKEIGDNLKMLLLKVYANKVKNNREDLLKSIR
jgi:tRNA nucleotidyltransferase/poly(A) polymerase